MNALVIVIVLLSIPDIVVDCDDDTIVLFDFTEINGEDVMSDVMIIEFDWHAIDAAFIIVQLLFFARTLPDGDERTVTLGEFISAYPRSRMIIVEC